MKVAVSSYKSKSLQRSTRMIYIVIILCLLAVALAEPEANPQVLAGHPLHYSHPYGFPLIHNQGLPLTYSNRFPLTYGHDLPLTYSNRFPLHYNHGLGYPFGPNFYPRGVPAAAKE
ncbi:uncharacterized protein LOC135202680 isoform X1 [Macrobrachium nipponense]|uniref:uncharacterized protein LOC135202680 isoform X1 n=1 Tax=Macrobrachium nipponense TaxID=159736 RepID=UPI0030C7F75E